MRRTMLVDKNKVTRRDWEYESSDDEGENLGSAVLMEEEDEYDSDDEDAPKKPKTEEELMKEQLEAIDKS